MLQFNTNPIHVNNDEVEISLPGDRVVRDVLKQMEQQSNDLYTRSPGFIVQAALAGFQSTQLTTAIVNISRNNEDMWAKIERAIAYVQQKANPLSQYGAAMSAYATALISASGTGTNKEVNELFEGFYKTDDFAQFALASADGRPYDLPTTEQGVRQTKTAAEILEAKAADGVEPGDKALASIFRTARRFAEGNEVQFKLTGDDCVETFKTQRADSTEINAAPASVRNAVLSPWNFAGGNGETRRQSHQAQA